jgi:phospho-N-acetylmuramoyl-pentapeptide-transferase
MLYQLFEWFAKMGIKFPGSGLVHFITFRVVIAVLLSLVITNVYGKRLINIFKRKLNGESVRDLGLAGEKM